MTQRDRGIDFLMFIAVLLVVNSHLENMYVAPFKPLATGGVIGDALFFFCSGYKLCLGRMDRFDNWFKRRIVRIYPSVVVWDVLAALIFSLPLTVTNLFDGWWFCGYWFIKCIMVHYVILYLIRRFFADCLRLALILVYAGVLVWWCLAYSPEFAMAMLGASKFEWFYLFAFTLLGGILAQSNNGGKQTFKFSRLKLSYAVVTVFLSLMCHYGWLVIVGRFPALMPMRVLLLVPLTAVVLSLYALAKTDSVQHLMERRCGFVLTALGGLCLEVYISHGHFYSDKFNGVFPLNIIGFFAVAFVVAYLIRSVTRFILQTLDKGKPYDYREIFKV